jgi:hypothetical protein
VTMAPIMTHSIPIDLTASTNTIETAVLEEKSLVNGHTYMTPLTDTIGKPIVEAEVFNDGPTDTTLVTGTINTPILGAGCLNDGPTSIAPFTAAIDTSAVGSEFSNYGSSDMAPSTNTSSTPDLMVGSVEDGSIDITQTTDTNVTPIVGAEYSVGGPTEITPSNGTISTPIVETKSPVVEGSTDIAPSAATTSTAIVDTEVPVDGPTYWWLTSGLDLSRMLVEAGYSEECRRQFLEFFRETICPLLGGRPEPWSLPAAVGWDGNPFEYSFEFKGSTKKAGVRFVLDLTELRPAKKERPLDVTTVERALDVLRKRSPLYDETWVCLNSP